jgi:rhodanese-related sulfurtransferase
MKKISTFSAGLALSAVIGLAVPAAHADAALRSVEQLKFALRTHAPCCVIDARSAAQRAAQPLAEALVWREDLRIEPTASVVVVVADNDVRALEVAQQLAQAHPGKAIWAVEGGVQAWSSVLAAETADPPGGRALQFVIPRNTCESGSPLQHLRTAPQ